MKFEFLIFHSAVSKFNIEPGKNKCESKFRCQFSHPHTDTIARTITERQIITALSRRSGWGVNKSFRYEFHRIFVDFRITMKSKSRNHHADAFGYYLFGIWNFIIFSTESKQQRYDRIFSVDEKKWYNTSDNVQTSPYRKVSSTQCCRYFNSFKTS